MFPDLLAALSEGQRAIAHLIVLLVLLAAAVLVFVVRRRAGRARPRTPEEER